MLGHFSSLCMKGLNTVLKNGNRTVYATCLTTVYMSVLKTTLCSEHELNACINSTCVQDVSIRINPFITRQERTLQYEMK